MCALLLRHDQCVALACTGNHDHIGLDWAHVPVLVDSSDDVVFSSDAIEGSPPQVNNVVVCITRYNLHVLSVPPMTNTPTVTTTVPLIKIEAIVQSTLDPSLVGLATATFDLVLKVPHRDEFVAHTTVNRRALQALPPMLLNRAGSEFPKLFRSSANQPKPLIPLRSSAYDFMALAGNGTVKNKLLEHGDTAIEFTDRVYSVTEHLPAPAKPNNVVILCEGSMYVTETGGKVVSHAGLHTMTDAITYRDEDMLITVKYQNGEAFHFHTKNRAEFLKALRNVAPHVNFAEHQGKPPQLPAFVRRKKHDSKRAGSDTSSNVSSAPSSAAPSSTGGLSPLASTAPVPPPPQSPLAQGQQAIPPLVPQQGLQQAPTALSDGATTPPPRSGSPPRIAPSPSPANHQLQPPPHQPPSLSPVSQLPAVGAIPPAGHYNSSQYMDKPPPGGRGAGEASGLPVTAQQLEQLLHAREEEVREQCAHQLAQREVELYQAFEAEEARTKNEATTAVEQAKASLNDDHMAALDRCAQMEEYAKTLKQEMEEKDVVANRIKGDTQAQIHTLQGALQDERNLKEGLQRQVHQLHEVAKMAEQRDGLQQAEVQRLVEEQTAKHNTLITELQGSFQRKIDELERQNMKLQDENIELKEDNAVHRKALKELKDIPEVMANDQRHTLTSINAEHLQKLGDMTTKVDEAQDLIGKLRNELVQTQQYYEGKLAEVNDEYEKQLSEATNELDHHKGVIDELAAALDTTQQAMSNPRNDGSSDELRAQQSLIDQYQKHVAELEASIAMERKDFKQQQVEYKQQIEQLQQELRNAANNPNSDMQLKLDELRKAKLALQNEVDDIREQHRQDLSNERDRLFKGYQNDLAKEMERYKEQRDADKEWAKKELKELRDENANELKQARQEKNDKIAELKHEFAQRTKEMQEDHVAETEALKKKIKAQEEVADVEESRQRSAQDAKLQGLQRENDELNMCLKLEKERAEKFEKLYLEQHQQSTNMATNLGALTNEVGELRPTVAILRKELLDKEQSTDLLQTEIERHENKLALLEQDLAQQTSQYQAEVAEMEQELDARTKQLNNDLQTKNYELDELKNQALQYGMVIDNLRNELEERSKALETVNEELNKIKTHTQDSEKMCEELKTTNVEQEMRLQEKEHELRKATEENEKKEAETYQNMRQLEESLHARERELQQMCSAKQNHEVMLGERDIAIGDLQEQADELKEHVQRCEAKLVELKKTEQQLAHENQNLRKELQVMDNACRLAMIDKDTQIKDSVRQACADTTFRHQRLLGAYQTTRETLEGMLMVKEDAMTESEVAELTKKYNSLCDFKDAQIEELKALLEMKQNEAPDEMDEEGTGALLTPHSLGGNSNISGLSSSGGRIPRTPKRGIKQQTGGSAGRGSNKPGFRGSKEGMSSSSTSNSNEMLNGLLKQNNQLHTKLNYKQKVLNASRIYASQLEKMLDKLQAQQLETSTNCSEHSLTPRKDVNQHQQYNKQTPNEERKRRLELKRLQDEIAHVKVTARREIVLIQEKVLTEKAVLEDELVDTKMKLRKARENQLQLEREFADIEQRLTDREIQFSKTLNNQEEAFYEKEQAMNKVTEQLRKDLRDSELDVMKLEDALMETKQVTRIGQLEEAITTREDKLNECEVEKEMLREALDNMQKEQMELRRALDKYVTQQRLLESGSNSKGQVDANLVAAKSAKWISELEDRLKIKEDELADMLQHHKVYLSELQLTHEAEINDLQNRLARVVLPLQMIDDESQTDPSGPFVNTSDPFKEAECTALKKRIGDLTNDASDNIVLFETYKEQLKLIRQEYDLLQIENQEYQDQLDNMNKLLQAKDKHSMVAEETRHQLEDGMAKQQETIDDLTDELTLCRNQLLALRSKMQDMPPPVSFDSSGRGRQKMGRSPTSLSTDSAPSINLPIYDDIGKGRQPRQQQQRQKQVGRSHSSAKHSGGESVNSVRSGTTPLPQQQSGNTTTLHSHSPTKDISTNTNLNNPLDTIYALIHNSDTLNVRVMEDAITKVGQLESVINAFSNITLIPSSTNSSIAASSNPTPVPPPPNPVAGAQNGLLPTYEDTHGHLSNANGQQDGRVVPTNATDNIQALLQQMSNHVAQINPNSQTDWSKLRNTLENRLEDVRAQLQQGARPTIKSTPPSLTDSLSGSGAATPLGGPTFIDPTVTGGTMYNNNAPQQQQHSVASSIRSAGSNANVPPLLTVASGSAGSNRSLDVELSGHHGHPQQGSNVSVGSSCGGESFGRNQQHHTPPPTRSHSNSRTSTPVHHMQQPQQPHERGGSRSNSLGGHSGHSAHSTHSNIPSQSNSVLQRFNGSQQPYMSSCVSEASASANSLSMFEPSPPVELLYDNFQPQPTTPTPNTLDNTAPLSAHSYHSTRTQSSTHSIPSLVSAGTHSLNDRPQQHHLQQQQHDDVSSHHTNGDDDGSLSRYSADKGQEGTTGSQCSGGEQQQGGTGTGGTIASTHKLLEELRKHIGGRTGSKPGSTTSSMSGGGVGSTTPLSASPLITQQTAQMTEDELQQEMRGLIAEEERLKLAKAQLFPMEN